MSDKKTATPGVLKKCVARVTNIKVINFIEIKLLYIICASFVLLGDVITKAMAVALSESGKENFTIIKGFLAFDFSENLGMAAGKFAEDRLVFMIPTVVMLSAVFLYLIFDNGWNPTIGLSLSIIFGGGLGNLVERLSGEGGVVDFIYVVPFNFFPFTCVFNVADVFICIGAGIIIFELLKSVLADVKKEVSGSCESPVVEPPVWVKFFMDSEKKKESEGDAAQNSEESEEATENNAEDNG